MDIFRIDSKYCTDDKVQLMLSNAPYQIICSSKGYKFLREGDFIIHPYIEEIRALEIPYKNNPISKGHVNHLFEFDKLYVKVTSDRRMGRGCVPSGGCYDFTFLYFTKLENGEALGAEIPISNYKSNMHRKVQYLNKKELEDFLYGINEVSAKIIFDGQLGIKYVRHKNEEIFIKKDWLDISDRGIIEEYNSQKEDENVPIFNAVARERLLKERPWEIHNIDEIKEELTLTYHGMLDNRFPTLIIFKGGEVEVLDFKVSFCKRDCFRVETKAVNIIYGIRELMTYAANVDCIQFTSEPDFD